MNDNLFNPLLNQLTLLHSDLHFLRADWFYAFIPLLLYLLLAMKKSGDSRHWSAIIDARLLPFVLRGSNSKKRRYPLLLVFIASSLCITALAGPVYKKLPQPVYREQSSLVILLDLSQSMNAADIKPSRLARARLELLDILQARKSGQTALIVYAADAFVVTPLTDDNATIANLLPALETDMMPAQGSDLSAALGAAAELFSQAGILHGNILLLTDAIHERHESAIKKIVTQGHNLSIFGFGTAAGAPIPLAGGFLQDSSGAIVIPALRAEQLQAYAMSTGGVYTGLAADGSDTDRLTAFFESSASTQDLDPARLQADIWQEEGHWLLLPLLFFAALWARKGWLAVFIVSMLLLPLPLPVYAQQYSNDSKALLDSKHLWSRPDQKAMRAFDAGDHDQAASLFADPDWKASAYYRQGDYAAAATALENTTHSDGFYNRGNALARLGRYEEAIAAYQQALTLEPQNSDARDNLEQVRRALQQQQQQDNQQDEQQGDQQHSETQDKNQQGEQDQQQDADDKQQQPSARNQPDQQPSEQDSSDQGDSQQSRPDQNQSDQQQPGQDAQNERAAEDEQLKQRDAEAEKQQQQDEQQQYEQQQYEQQQKQQQDDAGNQGDNENRDVENKPSEEKPAEIEINPIEASISEQEKASEQWLKRVPDDPGGLLRRKFLYQYKHLPDQSDDNQPW